ncbi:lipopolysaccharide assembly LapA domain-containing protein [Kibdelosporangium persicum]|uniref:Integral membrane protein n=1 Tax=Kibdelosporangium persicum TaxID=2698649 RepID=A0ABX2FDL6_9PSEU|nr:lipopolysaccharide assembly protein LapA domain-containing protein [Kibdelosporangium persicum]NRN68850.1 putative integral membrane protein [Kibdelosporangium persicum]
MTNPETPPTDEFPVQQPHPTGTDSPVRVTKATRTSGTWIAVIVATVLLVFLLIFILENLTTVTVSFLGMSGGLPLGVALLFAAISGALLVALIGGARIMQLRHRVRRAARVSATRPAERPTGPAGPAGSAGPVT